MPRLRPLFCLLLSCSFAARLAQGRPGVGAVVPVPPSPAPAPADTAEDALPSDSAELDSLLRWGIEHSDPQELRRLAAETTGGASGGSPRITLAELREKQARVAEAMDFLKSLPTEADMVRRAVELLLANGTAAADEQAAEQALQALLELAESADVANDFEALGALEPLLAQLVGPSSERRRALAAHVLGTGAGNNPPFAAAVAARGGVAALLARLAADEGDAAAKALFALAQLARAAGPARDAFAAAGGPAAARALLASDSRPLGLRRKALVLLTDLADVGLAHSVWGQPVGPAAAALVGLIRSAAAARDWDLAEKALRGAAGALRAEAAAAAAAMRAAGAAEALEALRTGLAAAAYGEAGEDTSFLTELLVMNAQLSMALRAAILEHDEL